MCVGESVCVCVCVTADEVDEPMSDKEWKVTCLAPMREFNARVTDETKSWLVT